MSQRGGRVKSLAFSLKQPFEQVCDNASRKVRRTGRTPVGADFSSLMWNRHRETEGVTFEDAFSLWF